MLEQMVGGRKRLKPLLTMYNTSNTAFHYYNSNNYQNDPNQSTVEPYYFDNVNGSIYITQAGTGRNGETTAEFVTSNGLVYYPNFNNTGEFTISTTEFSFEAWCKFGGNSSGQYRLFGFGQYGSSTGYNYIGSFYYTNSDLGFNVFPLNNTSTSLSTYISLGISNTNIWNHIAIEYFNGQFNYFANGVLMGSYATTINAPTIGTICFGRIFRTDGANDLPYTYNGNMYGIVYHPSRALRKANFSIANL